LWIGFSPTNNMNPAAVTLRVVLAAVLGFLFAPLAHAQQRRLITPQDILRVATVSDVQLSPNGAWVVYTVSTTADDKTISTLWLANANAGAATPIVPSGRRVPYGDWSDVRTGPSP